jgi:hypothetical protein
MSKRSQHHLQITTAHWDNVIVFKEMKTVLWISKPRFNTRPSLLETSAQVRTVEIKNMYES